MSFANCESGDLDEIFTEFDKDGSGFIERKELLAVLRALAKRLKIDDDECKASTKTIMDRSNKIGVADNKLSKDEFRQLLM